MVEVALVSIHKNTKEPELSSKNNTNSSPINSIMALFPGSRKDAFDRMSNDNTHCPLVVCQSEQVRALAMLM